MSYNMKALMLFRVILAAVFIFVVAVSGKDLEYEIIHGKESPGKIRLFVFAEGYPEFMKTSYGFDVSGIIDTLFTISPFADMQDLFIVYKVWTPSLISYIPVEASDSTYFGGYRGTGGPPKISDSGFAKITKIKSETPDSGFYCDRFHWAQQNVIIFNGISTSNPGVSYSGRNLILLSSSADGYVLAHELGHQLASLVDEYERNDYTSTGPDRINATQHTNIDSIPWKCWIDSGTALPTEEISENNYITGAYEGAYYSMTGWYRPEMGCIMRGSIFTDFCPTFCKVCREAVTSAILSYRAGRGPGLGYYPLFIDTIYPDGGTTVHGGCISARCISSELYHPQIQWMFNDSVLSTTDTSIDLSQFTCNGTVSVTVSESCEYIRNPKFTPAFTFSWKYDGAAESIVLNDSHSANARIRMVKNGVYSVPVSNVDNVYAVNLLGRTVPARISYNGKNSVLVDLNRNTANGGYHVFVRKGK